MGGRVALGSGLQSGLSAQPSGLLRSLISTVCPPLSQPIDRASTWPTAGTDSTWGTQRRGRDENEKGTVKMEKLLDPEEKTHPVPSKNHRQAACSDDFF